MNNQKPKFNPRLFFLISIHFFANLYYRLSDIAPLPWDQANHTRLSLLLKNCLLSGKENCLKVSDYYPIFTHTVTAVFLTIFGNSIFLAQMTGTLFFIFLLTGVYFYFNKLTSDENKALWITVIFSFFPVIFHGSRYLWLDIPLLGCVFWSMYFALESEGLAKTKPTILVFFFASLAMMTKWYAPIYLLIPLIFELVTFSKNKTKKYFPVISGVIIFLLITLPWYLANLNSVISKTFYYSAADPSQPPVFSLKGFLWYFEIALKWEFGPILFALSLIGTVFFFLKSSHKKTKLYIGLIYISTYLVFSLLGNKDMRFTYIFIPFACFFIVNFFDSLPKKPRIIFKSALLMWLVFFFLNFTFSFPVQKPYKSIVKLPFFGWIEWINLANYPVERPNTNYYPVKEIVNDFNNLSSEKDSSVLIVFDYPRLNSTNLILEQLVNPDKDKFTTHIESFFVKEGLSSQNQTKECLQRWDYALVSQTETAYGYFRFKNSFDLLQNELLSGKFKEVKRYSVPILDITNYLKETSPVELVNNRANACLSPANCSQLILFSLNGL